MVIFGFGGARATWTQEQVIQEQAMKHQLRRILPRQSTDWRGMALIEGDPDARWRDCRVIDVSSAGAGLELLQTTPQEAEGQNLILAVHLRAAVKNTGPIRGPILRVGTQFVDLSASETAYLASLAKVDAHW
jgi:hypothetical protein